MAKGKFSIDSNNLEKLALQLLNDPTLVKEVEDIGEKIKDEVESHSDNSKKFKWEVETVKTGDRTSVRIGSNSEGASRYEFFSGVLFNSTNKRRG